MSADVEPFKEVFRKVRDIGIMRDEVVVLYDPDGGQVLATQRMWVGADDENPSFGIVDLTSVLKEIWTHGIPFPTRGDIGGNAAARRGLAKALDRRASLTERLVKALGHLPVEQRVSIVSSFIPLDELEEVVKFQEREG
jgi:hypothetical protein